MKRHPPPTSILRAASLLAIAAVVVAGCSDAAAPAIGADDAGPSLAATDASLPVSASDGGAIALDGATPPTTDAASSTSDGGSRSDGAACVDSCPAKAGITWGCERRFAFGINYAWSSFGADFGGIAAWQQPGVAATAATHARNLAAMTAHGANVVRWWIFPDFRGDGIAFDGADAPTGLGGTTVADVTRALELADQAGVYLMLTVFSFDAFRPTADVNGLKVRGIAPILHDASKRAALLARVVTPLARAVEASPHRRRMLAWDVINEPEWAMTGASPYGDPDYTPTAGLDTLTHAEMESFVKDTAAALRSESRAQITVGAAAVKWAHAWKNVGVDFYQFHYYDWINQHWPYTNAPGTYGLDKPLLIGEFPVGDLAAGVPYADVVASFYANGYAGALSWAFDGAASADLDHETAFAAAHPCDTHFDGAVASGRGVASIDAPRLSSPALPSVRSCHRGADGRPWCDPPR